MNIEYIGVDLHRELPGLAGLGAKLWAWKLEGRSWFGSWV